MANHLACSDRIYLAEHDVLYPHGYFTDEPTEGDVDFGLACDALTESAAGRGFSTSPSVALSGPQEATTYFFDVEAADEAGNTAGDDNDGACYSFTTVEPLFYG